MAKFEDAIGTILENEGGLVQNPNDPGGLTNFGISQKSYPNLDIKNLTREQAAEIYQRDFWQFDGVASQPVATKIFDSVVNMGHAAIKIAQRLVNVVDDGDWGPNTEKAVNLQDPYTFISRYRIGLIQHYLDIVKVNPADAEFLTGWLRRARQ